MATTQTTDAQRYRRFIRKWAADRMTETDYDGFAELLDADPRHEQEKLDKLDDDVQRFRQAARGIVRGRR